MSERGTIPEGEPHPMAYYAREWILDNYSTQELFMMLESMASCAIEGNFLAEVCCETLDRMLHGKPYSDRYVMGLAWYLHKMKENDNDQEEKSTQ